MENRSDGQALGMQQALETFGLLSPVSPGVRMAGKERCLSRGLFSSKAVKAEPRGARGKPASPLG